VRGKAACEDYLRHDENQDGYRPYEKVDDKN